MTQAEFAKELGVCIATISNIERGLTIVKVEQLNTLYLKFGLNINWLLTGRGNVFAHGEQLVPGEIDFNHKYYELLELMQIPKIEKEVFKTLREARKLLLQQEDPQPPDDPNQDLYNFND